MRIKFLSDYLGRETAMKEYKAGDVDDFGVAQALELIRLGVAEEVPEIETTSIMDDVRTFEYAEDRNKIIIDSFGKPITKETAKLFNEATDKLREFSKEVEEVLETEIPKKPRKGKVKK